MKTIYKAIVGSKAFGLATDQSDTDYFTIVLPPAECIVGLADMKGSQKIDKESGIDERLITLKEFLRGVLNGRSNEIECLFVEEPFIVESSVAGNFLIENRNKLLSKRMYKSLLGFTIAQKARMLKGNTNRFNPELGYDPKCAAYGFRAIFQAIELKKSGLLYTILPEEWQQNLILSLKKEEGMLLKEVFDGFNDSLSCFDLTEDDSDLPTEPDYDFWNNFLMETYRYAIN